MVSIILATSVYNYFNKNYTDGIELVDLTEKEVNLLKKIALDRGIQVLIIPDCE